MVQPSDEPISLFERLTTRELDILGLLADGHSDKEIANRLSIAYTTVKWYNRQIFNKLGVSSRRQAIEHARASGLLLATNPAAIPPHKYRLPAAVTPFVGRKHNLAELLPLICDEQNRLVTILAPGGMGKTLACTALLPTYSSSAGSRYWRTISL